MRSIRQLISESRDVWYVASEVYNNKKSYVEEFYGPYSYRDEADEDCEYLRSEARKAGYDIFAMVYDSSELLAVMKRQNPGGSYHSESDLERLASSKSSLRSAF